MEAKEELRAIPELQIDSSSNDETFNQHIQLLDLARVSEEDTMSYPELFELLIGGHLFRSAAVVLKLDGPGAYPLLLGQPWLKTTRIKQICEKNFITFPEVRQRCD